MEKKKSPFIIQKISNYGTSHPVVARLMCQTMELLKWTTLDQKSRDDAATIYVGLKDRLLKCLEVLGRLQESFNDALKVAREQQEVNAGKVNALPFLIGLEGETDTFLYETKNFLRDSVRVLNVFYGTNFSDASEWFDSKGKTAGKISEWMKKTFGENDYFVKMMFEDAFWIEELIRKRNAVEHPGGHNGTLHRKNFAVGKDGKLIPPIWYRDTNEPTQILSDIEVYCHNLLTFAEELITVGCIVRNFNSPLVTLVEIPETDRRKECPERFRVTLKQGLPN